MINNMNLFGDIKHEFKYPIFKNSIDITSDMFNGIQYNGSCSKFGITYRDEYYMMKLQKRDWLNVQTELISSRFIKYAGLQVHDVLPALYDGKQVVLCKDFTYNYGKLKTLETLSASSIDTDNSIHEYYLEDVLYELSKLRNIDVVDAIESFYKMYVMDTILGNSDRHKGNWGILNIGQNNKKTHVFAPIFDNDACLFPGNFNYKIDRDWMYERIYTFPNSKIMFCEKPKRERSSYYDVWNKGIIPDNIIRYASKLDAVDIMEHVMADFGLQGNLASYYRTIVYYRHKCIVLGEPFYWKGMV